MRPRPLRPLLARAATLLLLAVPTACGGAAEPAAETRLGPLELVEELRGGGYVLYLRHALTDRSREDDPVVDLADCATQRNLSPAGRRQARELGAALEELRVPTGSVRASEYCRTRETAELAFGAAAAEPALTGFPERSDPSYETRVRETEELLGRVPPADENTVLVAHVKNLEEVAGVSIAEGELAVFEPLGGRRYRLRGRIPPELWPHLLEEARR
jgi:phosphohistidine phosphatase SixA